MIGIAVTGTDTGVGKTIVAAAISVYLREAGLSVGCMKPVETGMPLRADAAFLREASGTTASLDEVCPVSLEAPLAPAVAAELRHSDVSIDLLDRMFARLSAGHDFMVVEGAGGLATPITWTVSFGDLFARWRLPLIVVAQDKLGAINHLALTLEYAGRVGLDVLAVVLNARDQSRVLPSNKSALERIAAPVPVFAFPYLENARNISFLSGPVRESGLGMLLSQMRENRASTTRKE